MAQTATPRGSRVWIVSSLVFLGILLPGGIYSLAKPKSFTAKASISILLPETVSSGKILLDDGSAEEFLAAQAAAISDRDFLGSYATRAGLAEKWKISSEEARSVVERSMTVSRRTDAPLVDIFYSSPDPDEAAEIANGLGEAFTDHWKRQHEESDTIALLQRDKELIDASAEAKAREFSRLQSLEVEEAILLEAMRDWESTKARSVQTARLLAQVSGERVAIKDAVRIVQPASRETVVMEARSPSRFFFLFGGAFVASICTGFLLFLQSRRRTSISAISKAVAPPTLTLLPEGVANLSDYPDPFRKLRVAILNSHPEPDGVTIASTSFLRDENASGVSCELARILAIGGHSTLLIDGNIQNPSIHGEFDAAPQPGVTEYLVEGMALHETAIKTRVANLWIMPGGCPREDSSNIIGSERMSKLLGEARRRFDFIVINSPSLMTSTDALTLIGDSDMTFLATEAGRARRDILVKARNAIEQTGGKLSGLILTRVNSEEVMKRNSTTLT